MTSKNRVIGLACVFKKLKLFFNQHVRFLICGGLVALFGGFGAKSIPVAHAFLFGNGGGGPCLFACGGSRGIVNTRFFGDAANEYFFQPSIDKLGEKFDQLGEKYMGELRNTLDDKLKDLNKSAKERLADLKSILKESTADLGKLADEKTGGFKDMLDDAGTVAIAKLDTLLTQKMNEAEEKSAAQAGAIIAGLESTQLHLLTSLMYGGIILCLVLVLGSFYSWILRERRTNYRRIAYGLGGGALICIIVTMTAHFMVRSEENLVRSEVDRALAAARKDGDWGLALQLTTRLSVRTQDPQYSSLKGKLKVLRSYFLTPTALRSPDKAKDLVESMIAALKVQSELTGKLDPDLSIALAEILGTQGDTRLAHLTSALLVYHALAGQASDISEEGLRLKPTALYLLKAYLLYPFSDAEVSRLVGKDARSVVGLSVPIPVVALEDLIRTASTLEEANVLTANSLLRLDVRRLTLKTHLAYSGMLSALMFIEHNESFPYDLISLDLTSARQQSLYLASEWEELLTSNNYRNSTPATKLIIMQAPFAVIDRLNHFEKGYRQLTSLLLSISCGGRYPAFRRARAVHSYIFDTEPVLESFLKKAIYRVNADRLIATPHASMLYLTKSEAMSAQMLAMYQNEQAMIHGLIVKEQKSEQDQEACPAIRVNGENTTAGSDYPLIDSTSESDKVDLFARAAQAAGTLGLSSCVGGNPWVPDCVERGDLPRPLLDEIVSLAPRLGSPMTKVIGEAYDSYYMQIGANVL